MQDIGYNCSRTEFGAIGHRIFHSYQLYSSQWNRHGKCYRRNRTVYLFLASNTLAIHRDRKRSSGRGLYSYCFRFKQLQHSKSGYGSLNHAFAIRYY